MSVAPPADVLVDRPAVAEAIVNIIRDNAHSERTRRRTEIMLAAAPWAIAGFCGLFAIGAGIVVAHRPVPVPEMHVAIYRSDGSVEGPTERGSMTIDRKTFAVKADLMNFIKAWESYAWQGNQSYYNWVSAMTAGTALQTAYQASWTNRSSADNRDVKYGPGVTRYPAQTYAEFLKDAPYALTARVLIKTTPLTGTATCEWWQANLTYRQDNNTIPLDKQAAYTPMDLIVLTYTSFPADPGAKPWPC